MSSDSGQSAKRGWDSDFRRFSGTPSVAIVEKLLLFLPGSSREQVHAWRDSIPRLQREVGEVVQVDTAAGSYTAILEYELPMESRRTDAIFLLRANVVVAELKGKGNASDADIDQAHAYARDLRCYHGECDGRDVIPVLVATHATGFVKLERGVHVMGPDHLDKFLASYRGLEGSEAISPSRFLAEDAYRPLPTLVSAARELFHHGTLRRVKRAAAATDPAAECISEIIHESARTKTRRLVLLTGVPGAGKTLVGLRIVHSHFIDDLAVARSGKKSTAPAVFLSGNGPLVTVLQYELKGAGGGGKVFVRDVKNYVKRHESNRSLVPSEHVLVYDEAQRAYDAAMVAEKHPHFSSRARSEPEMFVEFAQRIPEWCVVIALIGSGQEIHKGEEGGVQLWARAIAALGTANRWIVHGPHQLHDFFAKARFEASESLSLDVSLRSHLAHDVHSFVGGLVDRTPAKPEFQAVLGRRLMEEGHDLRITRDLQAGKQYLRVRYEKDRQARFGLVASSRDRDLPRFGVQNDFQTTKRLKFGPWYGDAENEVGGYSCRHLRECVTEFGAQGLELDATLIAWGTDFQLRDGAWSIERMAKYKRSGTKVHDPLQLRANAYRVLLTRARDASVVFLPDLHELDETYSYLVNCGFRPLVAD